jgi:hypothetical protein
MNESRDENLNREAVRNEAENTEHSADQMLTTPSAVGELLDEELETVSGALDKGPRAD